MTYEEIRNGAVQKGKKEKTIGIFLVSLTHIKCLTQTGLSAHGNVQIYTTQIFG